MTSVSDGRQADQEISTEATMEFARAMLAALGQTDIRRVIGFELRVLGAFPELVIRRALPQGAGEAAAQVIERYKLVPINVTSGEPLDESVCLTTREETVHRVAG